MSRYMERQAKKVDEEEAFLSPVRAADAIREAARRVVTVPPSEQPAAIDQLRQALDNYDDLLDRMVKALGG
jgi:predicted dinucleotide-binding enzyme